jgi:hypothetical protein
MTEKEIRYVVAGVKYKDWAFNVNTAINGGPTLTILFTAYDWYLNRVEAQMSRKWILEPRDESELLRTVWLAVITAEEHEAREKFTYRDKRIFGPHANHIPKEAMRV